MFLILLAVTAQKSDPPNKRKKLTSSDYKGVPEERFNFFAMTKPVLSLQYFPGVNCNEKGKFKLNVETNVSVSEKSWIRFDRIKNQEMLTELLSHEQGHFDLKELFAIDLKKTLSAICFDKNRYKLQVDSILQTMNRHYDSLQLKYDDDTDHMRNRAMQLKWKQNIRAMFDKNNH